MKVKVTKVPSKNNSSEKSMKVKVKTVPEGLPKADIGKRMAKKKADRMESAWKKDIAQYPNADVSPSQNMSGVDTDGNPISINPNNNPLLTNPLFNLKRGQFNNYQINEDNTFYSGSDSYVENPKYSDSKSVENKKGFKNKKRANSDFSNFNVYLSGLNPKYNYLTNKLIGEIGNAKSIFKTGAPMKNQNYLGYNPYYSPFMYGGYLPEYQDAGMTGTTTDDSQDVLGKDYSQLDEYLGGLDRSGRKDYLKGLKETDPETRKEYGQYKALKTTQKMGAIGAPLSTLGTIGMEATGDALSFIGDKRQSDEFNKMNAQIRAQAPMANVQPTTLPTSFQGDNPLATGAYGGRIKRYAADGMQIKQIGGMGEPNVEVEGKEHIQLPNGFSQEIKGKKHSEGGIPINLPSGTKIFSEKLKVPVNFLKEAIALDPENQMLKSLKLPKTGKVSYADLAKKFETKKYVDLLNSKDADAIQMTTAQLMIQQNNAKLEELFGLQEQNKISGVHGPQVQQNAQQEQQEQEAQQAQMQGEEMEQPMMKYGGLYKAQDGYKTPKSRKEFLDWYKSKKEEIKNLPSKWDRKADQPTFVKNLYKPLRDELDDMSTPEDMSDEEFSQFYNDLDKELTNIVTDITFYYGFGKIPSDYKPVFDEYFNSKYKAQPLSVQLINQQGFTPATNPTFTGINPNVDLKTLRLQESEKERRNKFLPFAPNEIPTSYGSQLGLESVFSDFENTYGVKLPTGTNEQKLKALREYQSKLTPELTQDYKLNFARGNEALYSEFQKSKGYKKAKDNQAESQNFYDWAKNSGKLTQDYANKGLWGHEYYNVAPLKFNSKDEYNTWLQDPDWKKVGNYYVDRSADPNQPITYYDVKIPSSKKKEEQEADAMRGKTSFVPSEGSAARKGIPFNLGIGLPIPQIDSVYAGDYYKLQPQLEFLKRVTPDYNPATRAMRAMVTNDTDLSGVGMANRQNAYANFLNQMGDIQNQANLQNIGIEQQEKFGNRASIEQADRINLQGYQNYMGDYLKALGAKGTQEGLRKEAEKNYFSNAIKEANTINALQQAYFPGQYAQGTLGDVLETNPVAKYGGKVKKKVKIKPKLKNSYF